MQVEEAFERFFGNGVAPVHGGEYGDGNFGRWITDGDGNPAYLYEWNDPEADHWHMLGNDRIVATAHSGGHVQLYDWTRGGKVVNWHAPRRGANAGGFKFVQTRADTWCTHWSRLPQGAGLRRVFGMGYFEKASRHADLEVVERIEAPAGDDPVLLSTTAVRNYAAATREIVLVEYWGARLHQLTPAPVMTHGLHRFWEWRRDRLNRRFRVHAEWDAALAAIRIVHRHASWRGTQHPACPTLYDQHPKQIFLAALDPLPGGYRGFIADPARFFRDNDHAAASAMDGTMDGALLSPQRAHRRGAILAFRRIFRLAPGEEIRFRYLYGCADGECVPDLVERYRQPRETPPQPTLELHTPEDAWLTRELRWHAHYLQAGSLYSDFFQTHFVDQGSAYGYLQGASGAPRDFCLFALPLVYLRPDLAKDILRMLMRAQRAGTGAFPYAFIGHGKTTGALVHSRSSDLDLFFFWALAEYLGATRDLAFFDEMLPYYPPNSGRKGTVLEHVHAAFRHLAQHIGLGPHGLIRCGTGDWNDLLIGLSRFSPWMILRGESALNAGLATLALPALADAIEAKDADFAAALRAFAEGQSRALRSLWTGQWVARGYRGHGDAMLGRDNLFLDAQAFGVLGGVWRSKEAHTLFEAIRRLCVAPEAAGARCLWPPFKGPMLEPGSDTNGGTWAAVDAWTAWAWATVQPEAAWRFYLRTTLAAHAEAYPDIWYGIWSGPDTYNASYHPRPGETFDVGVTPMTLFPVMNMNRHACPLFDAIKLAGIHPCGGRIVIDPLMPFDSFALRLPIIGAAYLPGRHRGYYAPVVSGMFSFSVRPPAGLSATAARLEVNGVEVTFESDGNGMLLFQAFGEPGKRVCWEITARDSVVRNKLLRNSKAIPDTPGESF